MKNKVFVEAKLGMVFETGMDQEAAELMFHEESVEVVEVTFVKDGILHKARLVEPLKINIVDFEDNSEGEIEEKDIIIESASKS